MDSELIFAIVAISLALVFYTIGVWSEKIQGTLKMWHVAFFLGGLLFDTLGTNAMGKMAGGFSLSLHGITGLLAIVLMFIHAVWAVVVVNRGQESELKKFHKFSVIVWGVWLIPYFLGMFLAMA